MSHQVQLDSWLQVEIHVACVSVCVRVHAHVSQCIRKVTEIRDLVVADLRVTDAQKILVCSEDKVQKCVKCVSYLRLEGKRVVC